MDRYRFGGNNSKPYLMREECLVNIDTMLDVRVASTINGMKKKILSITPIRHIKGVVEELSNFKQLKLLMIHH